MSDDKSLYIYGAGGHGLVIAEAATCSGWRVVGFIDEQPPTTSVGPWSVHKDIPADAEAHHAIVAIGDNMARRRIHADMVANGCRMANIIHPTAWVSPSAHLGEGIYVGPGAIINAQSQIDNGAIINSGAIVEHHCTIGAFAHIGPRSTLAGNVKVGALATLGVAVSVKPGIQIAEHATIGAGSVVIEHITAARTFAGVPARPL